jgi:hypothetical protein
LVCANILEAAGGEASYQHSVFSRQLNRML